MSIRLEALEIGHRARIEYPLTVEEVGHLRGWAYRLPTADRIQLVGCTWDLLSELGLKLEELLKSCDVLNETWQEKLRELCIFRDDLESLLWVVQEAPDDFPRSGLFAGDLVDFDDHAEHLALAIPENLIQDERLDRIFAADPTCWWSLQSKAAETFWHPGEGGIKPLPCPFCGSTDLIHDIEDDGYCHLVCWSCRATGGLVLVDKGSAEEKIKASIAGWNKRGVRQ